MASRSLGTLTVDLIARTGGFVQGMDKGSREAAKFRRKVKKDLEVVGEAFKLASAAAATALAAITVETVNSAREISRLSQIAGVSTREFQRYAAGARAVGIEQDKFADIIKDVNDKVGDFLQTGGGPLLDFFENVAPKVGVTAEQFRNLSGPQALELYVSSLEKANLSQSEMTFFLEAIANDATALIPLLRDGGAGFREIGDAAERAGGIIDDRFIQQSDQLAAAQLILQNSLKGVRVEIAEQVLPVLVVLSEALVESSNDAIEAEDDFNILGAALKSLAVSGTLAKSGLQALGQTIAGLAAAAANPTRAYEILKIASEDIAETGRENRELINDILNAGGGGGVDGSPAETRISRLAERLRQLREEATGAASVGGSDIGVLSEIVVPDRSLGQSNDAGAEAAAVRERIRFIDEAGQELEKMAQERRLREREQAIEHEEWLTDITKAGQSARMSAMQEGFTGIMQLTRVFAGEQSGVYQTLFAVQKAAAVAESIVAIQAAIAKAANSGPFPANLAAMASVASATAGLVSTIMSTSIQGQAHDGLMSVPKTGTYLLEKGERVTTAETSAKLDRQLENMQAGGGVRIINAIDPNLIGDYLGSSSGEKVIMNTIRKNQRTVQALATV